jgi:hypothetical protein
LGYLQDGNQWCHELQSIECKNESRGSNGPISLENLLINREEKRLSRHERYRIASVAASSLLQLDTTPWLAAKLEKKNILFYQKDSKVLLDHPYISHSFLSTPNLEAPKESPKTVSVASINPTRDSLASLGILLLELCFSETIENQHLRKRYLGEDGQPQIRTDFLTALDWVEMVDDEEPQLASIIRRCVNCSFKHKADWRNENFMQAVYANVVEPLEKLVDQRFKLGQV